MVLQQAGTVDPITSEGHTGGPGGTEDSKGRRLGRTEDRLCVQLSWFQWDLGEGAGTEPLESENGEAGTLPSTGRKYFR